MVRKHGNYYNLDYNGSAKIDYNDRMLLFLQGTQNFGGIRVGNGPTEDQAEIIQHDQLAQNFEEDSPEVREHSLLLNN